MCFVSLELIVGFVLFPTQDGDVIVVGDGAVAVVVKLKVRHVKEDHEDVVEVDILVINSMVEYFGIEVVDVLASCLALSLH